VTGFADAVAAVQSGLADDMARNTAAIVSGIYAGYPDIVAQLGGGDECQTTVKEKIRGRVRRSLDAQKKKM
jgi:hypothetical protein